MIKITERLQVSHFLVFYLIHSMQFGIGVLGFQRLITEKAGRDAWIAVILSGILIHISLWMIYKILNGSHGNIITVQKKMFGKWFGGLLSIIFCFYFSLATMVVLRTYIEIVEVWMFPGMNRWLFTIVFFMLVFYIISGGFRVVTGIAFFGTVLPIYILLTFIFPVQFSEIKNIFPIFDHSIKDIASASKSMSLTVLGFETLLIFYPFVKNPDKSKKWAHIAIAFTTLVYTYISIITILYFSNEQLQQHVWATLTIWKIIELPFVERFEYIGIASWIFIILPNICIGFWCASRTLKDAFRFNQKLSLIVILVVVFISIMLINTREQINILNDIVGQIGFYMMFGYIPLMYLLTLIICKIRGEKA